MLFRKSEPKKCHPTLALTVGALTVIGAVTVVNMSRGAIEKIKTKMKSMWPASSGSSCTPSCGCDEAEQY